MSETEQDRGHEVGVGADGAKRIRRIVRVRGSVQGVGFRMDAAREAERLGAAGTVRNLWDGTVEADVEGTTEVVEAMLDHLRQGPPSARVDGIDVRRETPRGATGFRISG
jgi:acylphosphatase